jgi:endonuclease G
MPTLTDAQRIELLELLLEIPATKTAEQRDALLFSLPPSIADSLDLSGDRHAAMVRLVERLDYWGQLADGRWAIEVMIRNAQRATRATQYEHRLEGIRKSFDLPAGRTRLAPLPEKIASDVSYLMPVGFLGAGHSASRAVARVCVPQVIDDVPIMRGGKPLLAVGTGWMIAPGLMMTNHHVIEARFEDEPPASAGDMTRQALGAQAWFDYVDALKAHVTYAVTALEASDRTLDYALLRVAGASTPEALPLADWGHLRVAPETYPLKKGEPVNIIQHPGGDVKQIAIRRNDCVGVTDGHEFQYLTDTMPGSSGSPVFNDSWQVVGLHRASDELPEPIYLKGETIKYNNVGVRIHAILRHLPAALRDEIAAALV